VVEFIKWDSTARLFRDVIITEKLDGTNACVVIERIDPSESKPMPNRALRVLNQDGIHYAVYAQSRNRLITPDSDNAGFAKWVEKNYQELFYVLGEGRHYGEWWGQGIGRKYDMKDKVFSVFNTAAWYSENMGTVATRADRAMQVKANIEAVPVIAQIQFNEEEIRRHAENLYQRGSVATLTHTGERFAKPEGICIYHKAADTVFKYTFDNNDRHKWEFDSEEEIPEYKGAIATLLSAFRRK
jgi:hypothetical protein